MEDNQLDDLEPKGPEVEKPEETIVGTVDIQKVSSTEPKVTTLMTIGSDQPQPGQNTETATVKIEQPSKIIAQSGRIKVLIEYPKGWKKEKHFKDGDIKETSPESADQFVKAGFATLVKE